MQKIAEVKKYLYERQDEILDGIIKCMQIPSIMGPEKENAPYGEGPKKALDYALQLGKDLGLRVKNVDNKAGWVEIGEGEEMVGILGHLDVVPLGEGWDYPGFDGTVVDGRIYGRGIMDDKGPTIGAIYGLKAIQESGIHLDRRIRVIFGTNEENGSHCIRHYVKCGEEIPVLGFTPDGDYPLIFFEKGMTTLRVGKNNPTQGKIKVLAFGGGEAANIVTQKCMLEVEGDLQVKDGEGIEVTRENGHTIVRAEGKSSHGSKPEKGINAAIRLFNAVKDNDFGGDFQNVMDFVLEQIGTETNGKKLGIHYFDEETGETTVNLGIFYFSEEKIEVSMDTRYPQNGVHLEVLEQIKEKLALYGLEVLSYTTDKMLYVPQDSELIQKLMKVYRRETKREEKPMAIGGGTYAKMFPNMVAFGPMFPEEPETIHQPNENVSIENLMLSIWLCAAAMAELATID